MARRKNKKTNARKSAKQYVVIFKVISEVLILIGRPFYLFFSSIILAIVFVLYLLGKNTRIFFEKIHEPNIEVPKIEVPAIKIGTKFKIFLGVIFGFALTCFLIWNFIFRGLPFPSELVNRKIDVSTKILDRNGVLLYQIYKDQNRTPVALTNIPDNVRAATLASEDADFYNHHGFSVKGIIRSIFNDLSTGELYGGSTITQQLVKNTLLTSEKTLIRKIKEVILAVQVESNFSKDQILEMYLNEVAYGGASYGIEAASQIYFNKDVGRLSLGEAALLAGLPKSPTTYSPFGANPTFAINRQREVLQLMVDNGFITKEEKAIAENEKITFAENKIDIKAPHFVMYVKQQLVNMFGEEMTESGGLTVTTTLDYNMQKMAEEVVKKQVTSLARLHVTNGGAVIMSPAHGEILAMVGSKDYFDMANDGNVNVTTALRPPGSAIKIVNYAYALAHGYTAASIIADTPIKFNLSGQKAYVPVNYDGKFKGNISLRTALAESRNIPAVKILASYGVNNMLDLGQEMGITTWKDPTLYGLSLTLGGGATKLIDMARVFATVATYGNRPGITSILTVTDYKGNNLEIECDKQSLVLRNSQNCEKKEVIKPTVAYILIDILKDNSARAGEFGSHSSLVVANHPEIAVKTGTSNDLRDNLTIGFNQKYVTAVWVGNNDNSPMSRIASGITGAAPIWNEIMSRLLASEKSTAWKVPAGIIAMPCPVRQEYFITGTQPRTACNENKIAESNQSKLVHD